MDLEKIQAFNEEQKRKAELAQEQADRQAQTDSVVGAVNSSTSKTQPVEITNDIATSEDIDSLLKQLKEVQLASLLGNNRSSVVLADSTDLGEAVSALGDKLDALVKLESDSSDQELIKTIKDELGKVVKTLQADTDSDVVAAVNDLKTAIEGLDVQPVVNVPKVTIPKTDVTVDLSPVAK